MNNVCQKVTNFKLISHK